MNTKTKRVIGMSLASTMLLGSLCVNSNDLYAKQNTLDSSLTELSDDEISNLLEEEDYDRVSVHDPSVVYDNDGTYYVFGSHMAVAKTQDFMNWTEVTSQDTSSKLFGNYEDGELVTVSYEDAFTSNAYDGEVTILQDGVETTVTFGTDYDISEWISSNTIEGNMWAPDVIYNTAMGKWCMYLSLNGATWNSSIVLLTADDIEGPYVYQGPVIYSGFNISGSSKDYHDTDLELVIGECDELPEKYQKISDKSWGTYWPHAIDPAVFYGDDGKLYMTYGSWSGGIYVIELDETTGLRDYTVTYEDTFDELGASCTSDPYFGTKIAGGYYVSGEGSYIEKIDDYYYLFISYGFYSPEGGYNMRVFRSDNPTGPYTDEEGNSAIFNKYIMNYSATDSSNNRGTKLMGGYQLKSMDKGEISQGHNSVITTDDGKALLVYHTKFNDNTVSHEVRVHQLFTNEDGYLVTAPYEYSGETIKSSGYDTDDIVGEYGLIIHDFQTAYSTLECQSEESITLNSDGTIEGAYTGTWNEKDGTAYATININDKEYKGVFIKQNISETNVEVMCFSAVSSDGETIWGMHEVTDMVALAKDVTSGEIVVPAKTLSDIEFVTTGEYGSTISYSSSNESVLSSDGKVTRPDEDTTVTITATFTNGDYYYEKEYEVVVLSNEQNDTDSIEVLSLYEDESIDLTKYSDGSLSFTNPFYKGYINGLDLTGGVVVEFDTTSTGTVNVLGTIFSFMADEGSNGRLYFTPGSYLGYNAGGYYYDANLSNYTLVKDYIGDSAHVKIELTQTGFAMYVDGELCYDESIIGTSSGAGTLEEYSAVLDFLYNDADKIYLGSGSWWSDVANNTISNLTFTVNPVAGTIEKVYNNITFEEDKIDITSTDFYEENDNPFEGENIKDLTISYTINMDDSTARNGWDGIFAFYNTSTTGRISFQTNPYICYNDASGNWIDINQPGSGGDDMASSMTPGTEYKVKEIITEDEILITVNGTKLELGNNGSGATYEDLLSLVKKCDTLTYGVGLAKSSYWNTEICTITDLKMEINDPDIEDALTNYGDDSKDDDDDDETDSEILIYGMKADVSKENVSSYESSDSDVAKVNESGIVTAKSAGDVTITINFEDGTSQDRKFTVEVPEYDKYTKVELNVGDTYEINFDGISIEPTYLSRKEKVASVDENGVITANASGTTIVVATFESAGTTCEYKFSLRVND